jgi:hypothetical protein
MTRRLSMMPLVLAAALGLVGAQAVLHAQGNGATAQAAPQTITVQTTPETQASLRDWKFPGMQPQSDNGSERVAVVTGTAVGDYAEVLDFYAKKMGASGYDPKVVAAFQPEGHSTGMGISAEDGAGFCYADSYVMHATMCRRYDHESVSVSLSEDCQGKQIHIALTDTTF